jgi:hypothetical protein
VRRVSGVGGGGVWFRKNCDEPNTDERESLKVVVLAELSTLS